MTPPEQKFLFVLVREVVCRGSGDQIEARRKRNKHIPGLRSLGYLEDENLTGMAFQEFFSTFELISCPTEVQQFVDSFGIEIHWRRPRGIIRNKLGQDRGLSYRNALTVFIDDGSALETWYHEFGHILYGCIKNNASILEPFKLLQQEAVATYQIVSHEEMTPVQHPVTNHPVSPPPGRYVLINGRYHGLDHSGVDEESEADELWASLFEEYHSCTKLKRIIRALVEEIIAAIRLLPKPLDPRDKD